MIGVRRWTLDLGNSAVKVVDWAEPGTPLRAVPWDELERDGIVPPGTPAPDEALLSSVVGGERLEAVVARLEAAGAAACVNPTVPLEVACRTPETVGRDRLLAAAGAWRAGGEPAVVVDAGTAVTVDALGAPGGAPSFLGGAIAPGAGLLEQALRRGGAQLAAYELAPRADARALGRDSREALEAGVVVGLQGAVRELVERVSSEADLTAAPLWITGGMADLLPDTLFPGRTVRREPLLVHLGLLAAGGVAGD